MRGTTRFTMHKSSCFAIAKRCGSSRHSWVAEAAHALSPEHSGTAHKGLISRCVLLTSRDAFSVMIFLRGFCMFVEILQNLIVTTVTWLLATTSKKAAGCIRAITALTSAQSRSPWSRNPQTRSSSTTASQTRDHQSCRISTEREARYPVLEEEVVEKLTSCYQEIAQKKWRSSPTVYPALLWWQ